MDAWTTWRGLSLGGEEMTPGSIQVMEAIGVGGWIVSKIAVSVILAFLSLFVLRKHDLHSSLARFLGYLLLMSTVLILLYYSYMVGSNLSQLVARGP